MLGQEGGSEGRGWGEGLGRRVCLLGGGFPSERATSEGALAWGLHETVEGGQGGVSARCALASVIPPGRLSPGSWGRGRSRP